jgi:hypothetical protein
MQNHILRDEYLRSLRNNMLEWKSVAEFHRLVDEAEVIVEDGLVVMNSAKFWREAKVAIRIAAKVEATHLKVNLSDPPDVILRLGHDEYNLEITEILDFERRRTKEYKEREPQSLRLIGENVINAAPAHVASEIKRLSLQKAKKLTGKECSLVFYINTSLSLFPRMINFDDLRDSCKELAFICPDVWLLIGDDAHLVWHEGAPVLQSP